MGRSMLLSARRDRTDYHEVRLDFHTAPELMNTMATRTHIIIKVRRGAQSKHALAKIKTMGSLENKMDNICFLDPQEYSFPQNK